MQERQEIQVWSLGREDPLEQEVAAHSSILAWKIPWGFSAIYFTYLFIYGCAGSSLLCMDFLWLPWAGVILPWSVQASQCDGFSYGAQASVVAAYGLSGCSVRAYLLRGMWHLPRSGIELMSPALAGRSLPIAPPGKFSWRFIDQLEKTSVDTERSWTSLFILTEFLFIHH